MLEAEQMISLSIGLFLTVSGLKVFVIKFELKVYHSLTIGKFSFGIFSQFVGLFL